MGVLRQLGFIAASVVLVALVASAAGATTASPTTRSCDGKEMAFHRHRARVILKHEYRVTYYSTHEVASKDKLAAFKEHKLCILDQGERRKLGERRNELAQFQKARIAATPYAGPNGTWWAIPVYIAQCESGLDYTPVGAYPTGGAYGLLQSWTEHGGLAYASIASLAPPWAQDLVAHAAWLHHDSWACA